MQKRALVSGSRFYSEEHREKLKAILPLLFRYNCLIQHKAKLEELETVLQTEKDILQQEKRASTLMAVENQKLREELERYLSSERVGALFLE